MSQEFWFEKKIDNRKKGFDSYVRCCCNCNEYFRTVNKGKGYGDRAICNVCNKKTEERINPDYV
jgi:hypothetical protein